MAKIDVAAYNSLVGARKALILAGLSPDNPAVVNIDQELAKHAALGTKTWLEEFTEIIATIGAKSKRLKDSKETNYGMPQFLSDVKTQRALLDSLVAKAPTA